MGVNPPVDWTTCICTKPDAVAAKGACRHDSLCRLTRAEKRRARQNRRESDRVMSIMQSEEAASRIAGLEEELDKLADAAERNRKLVLAARVAVWIAGLMLVGMALGLFRLGAVGLLLGVAVMLGGMTLAGSGRTTRDLLAAAIREKETSRAAMIDALNLPAADNDDARQD
jgi:hypothetical protein